MMKGQTQAVTATLITSVIIGSIGTVYFWGAPLLEKSDAQSEVNSLESNVEDLYDGIVEARDQGSGGSTSVTIDAERITVNESQNYIQISKDVQVGSSGGVSWNLLKGSNSQNISYLSGAYALKGRDLPGVISYRSTAGEQSSQITYRVDFRNMCSEDTGELELVDLTSNGQREALGETEIVASNEGTETDTGLVMPEGACEGQTSRTRNIISIELR